MKKSLLVALAVSVCLCVGPQAQQQQGARQRRGGLDNLSLPSTTAHLDKRTTPEGWQLFAPEGAGFSLTAPAGLEEITRRGREEGLLASGFRQYEVEAAGAKYAVGRVGPLAGITSEPSQYFALMREVLTAPPQARGTRAAARMELVRERVVALEGHEGREYGMAGGGRAARARVYLVDGVVFTLGVEGAAASFPEERARVFFDSFRLSPRP